MSDLNTAPTVQGWTVKHNGHGATYVCTGCHIAEWISPAEIRKQHHGLVEEALTFVNHKPGCKRGER